PGMEQGTVRQNFSHGRTKSVVVETKKRKFSRPEEREPAPVATVFKPKPQQARPAPPPPAAPQQPAAPLDRSGVVLNELSSEEMEARRRALQGSKVREAEERRVAAEEAKRR